MFDRWRIEAYKMPYVKNALAHSPELASIAVRVAAASYAFNADVSPRPEDAEQSREDMPFKSLKRHLAIGQGRTEREWYGPEGGRDSFAVSVVGGAAYGVLLKDFIFVGFRGTTNASDWAINLFGLDRSGPLKCPLASEYYARKYHRHFDAPIQGGGGRVHAGFYRVAQALYQPVNAEIELLRKKHREYSEENPGVILTGHSLGGAIALLSGIRIAQQAVYTFGMPRLCEADVIPELPSRHYRYVLEGDPVPNMPPEYFGYRHDMPSLCLDPYRGLK